MALGEQDNQGVALGEQDNQGVALEEQENQCVWLWENRTTKTVLSISSSFPSSLPTLRFVACYCSYCLPLPINLFIYFLPSVLYFLSFCPQANSTSPPAHQIKFSNCPPDDIHNDVGLIYLITLRESHMGFKFGDGSVIVANETKHSRTPGHVCRPSVYGHDLRYVKFQVGRRSAMVGQYKLPYSQLRYQYTLSSYTVL